MDGLYAGGMKLDTSRWEIRRSASGAEVLCAKTEAPWVISAPAPAPAPVPSSAEAVAATFAKMVITGGVAAAAPSSAATPARTPAPAKQYKVSELSLEARYAAVRAVGEECIQVRDTLSSCCFQGALAWLQLDWRGCGTCPAALCQQPGGAGRE